MKDEERHDEYVFKVREKTREYFDELIRDNGKLRKLIADLEEERLRRSGQLVAARTELDHQSRERERLQRLVEEIGSEKNQYVERYQEIEKQNNDLANLYVASLRLHATLDRQDVIATIQEIVINMIGSEEMAIFEVDEKTAELRLLASLGIDAGRLEPVELSSNVIGEALEQIEEVVASGERFVASRRTGPGSPLTICVPLVLDGRVTGAIAVFSLLDQKTELEPLDFELLDLLATHAATALYCSRRNPATPAE